ncbi:hypothetical protein BH10PSE19_BH10PSE19_20600 [soil metagenome]
MLKVTATKWSPFANPDGVGFEPDPKGKYELISSSHLTKSVGAFAHSGPPPVSSAVVQDAPKPAHVTIEPLLIHTY